jgi:hypothetical protein
LRYYQRKSFAEMSAVLEIDEAAARKRTSRAVEKLRSLLESKGISTTSTLLVAGLWAYTIQTAPASTAAGIAAVVATPAAASATVLTLTQGALRIMKWSNFKIGSIAAMLTLAAIGISFAVAQAGGGNNQQAAGKPAAVKPATAAAATGPATKAAAPLSPKGVVEAAYVAALNGDEDGMIKCFTGVTPEHEKTLRMVVRTMAAVEELRKSVASEFGENIAKQFAALGSGVGPADVTNAPETINGDRAIVDMGRAGPGPIPFEKVGDTWKVSVAVLQTMNVDGLAQWERKAPAIRKLAADIKAGKFQSPAELQKAMEGLLR